MEAVARMGSSWLKANGWQVTVTVIGIVMVVGQWREQQTVTVRDIQALELRLRTVEVWSQSERPRLDPIYLAREVGLAQNAEILRRLEAIEAELRSLRQQARYP
jgi:hypothetical protein